VAAGEPFTLVVEVTGVGNVDAVEPPSWSGNGSARLFPPTLRRERRDRDGVVAGRVVVETLVQQNEAGTVHVPALSLVTFSPDEGRYITRSAPPIDVVVGKGVAAPSSSRSSSLGRRSEVGQGQRPLALDIDARGSSPSDRPLAGGAATALAGGALGLALSLRRRRVGSVAGRASARRDERARAITAAVERGDVALLQRLLTDAIADRCGDDVRALESAQWEAALPARGLPSAVVVAAVEASRAVDAARYAPGGGGRAVVEAIAAAARAVDAVPSTTSTTNAQEPA
jgi:hypothetical protein